MSSQESRRTKLPIIPRVTESVSGTESQLTSTASSVRDETQSTVTVTREQRIAAWRQLNQDNQTLREENSRLAAENALLRELVAVHKAHSESMTRIVSQLIQNAPQQQSFNSLAPPPAYNETPTRQ